MRCLKCGGRYLQRSGNLRIKDDLIGFYIVYGVEWKECPVCKKRRYPISTVEKMEVAELEARDSLLQSMPLSDFISSTTAAGIIGISRQAFHKHRRIRRGFIYATLFDDKKVYLRKSVETYRKTEDGRIVLYNGSEIKNVEPEWRVDSPVSITVIDLRESASAVIGRNLEYIGTPERTSTPPPQYREVSSNGQITIH